MFGSRQPRGWARPAPALFSVLVLLAFAFFPALVQAETVYEPEQTTIPGQTKPEHQSKNSSMENPEANASGSGVVNNHGGSGGGPSGGASPQQGASPGSEGGANPGSPGKGSSADKNPGGQGKGSVGGAPASTSDDGGSSPLIPILIAIVVLAAISIGVVVARKRRGLGDPVSPKAN